MWQRYKFLVLCTLSMYGFNPCCLKNIYIYFQYHLEPLNHNALCIIRNHNCIFFPWCFQLWPSPNDPFYLLYPPLPNKILIDASYKAMKTQVMKSMTSTILVRLDAFYLRAPTCVVVTLHLFLALNPCCPKSIQHFSSSPIPLKCPRAPT